MHRKLIASGAACVVTLVFAAQPALAIGAVPALRIGETKAAVVQEIGQKGHYYYYGGYAYPYPYWGRPGMSIGLSF